MARETIESYRLTEEDYENIWLRNKEKMRSWVFGWTVFIAALMSIGAWLVVEKAASSAIDGYVGSEIFQESILQELTTQLGDLNQRLEEVDSTLQEIEIDAQRLDNLGFTVLEHGFSLADPNGEIVHLEYASQKTGLAEIEFKMPFKKPPLLLIFVQGDRVRSGSAFIREITPSRASVIVQGGRSFNATFEYIALGR